MSAFVPLLGEKGTSLTPAFGPILNSLRKMHFLMSSVADGGQGSTLEKPMPSLFRRRIKNVDQTFLHVGN
jgi:hypothetical protein